MDLKKKLYDRYPIRKPNIVQTDCSLTVELSPVMTVPKFKVTKTKAVFRSNCKPGEVTKYMIQKFNNSVN